MTSLVMRAAVLLAACASAYPRPARRSRSTKASGSPSWSTTPRAGRPISRVACSRAISRAISRAVPTSWCRTWTAPAACRHQLARRDRAQGRHRDGLSHRRVLALCQRAGEIPCRFAPYDFVAYQPGTSIYYVRTDVTPGIKTSADMMKAKGLVSGGLAADNSKDLLMRLALDMLGVSYQHVTGYRSNNTARMALQRRRSASFRVAAGLP